MKKALSMTLAILMTLGVCLAFPHAVGAADGFTATIYEDGMENWRDSPNKGAENAATQILFCPRLDGKWSAELFAPGLPVRVTMRSDHSVHIFDAQVATVFNGGTWGICRVEPCLLTGIDRFVPEKNVVYKASFTVTLNGREYTCEVSGDYILRLDPIVPERPARIDVAPARYGISNDRDGTYFNIGGVDAGTAEKLRGGEYALRVIIRDDTTGARYTVPRYAFDHPEKELDASEGILRIACCEYGIVPQKGHAYTVALGVFDQSGKLCGEGVSSYAAFDSFNDAFLSEGAIVPAVVPHEYKEAAIYPRFDADRSHTIDQADALCLLEQLARTEGTSADSTDYDRDGIGSIRDVAVLINFLEEGFLFTRSDSGDGWIFSACVQTLGDIAVPSSYRGEPVVGIAENAFENYRSVKTIAIPETVTRIGQGAFDGCAALKTVDYGGTRATFRESAVTLPEGCALICQSSSDPYDDLDFSSAAQFSSLDGYDGILRVKTTGELLFSPTLKELRNLVSAGARYEDFDAWLRFSGGGYTYPAVNAAPKQSKGGWVDFFLQGDGIDCGFCPTAGVTYAIEFALVRRSAPETVLYTGVFTATAGDAYAQSRYYRPTPEGQNAEKQKCLLTYAAATGGRIEGAAMQRLEFGQTGTPVCAVPEKGYSFLRWSDGKTEPERTDTASGSVVLTAYFERHYESAVPAVYLYTASGKPVLHKEYENATLVIHGAANEEYNVTLETQIKGRGNSSWDSGASQKDYNSKNSYSLKLAEKQKLLGIGEGKSKKWALNANKFDATSLRNYLAWDFARRMGTIGFVPSSAWVQLYVNDEYRGLYMLTEKADVERGRVEVDDSATGDPDKGYLVELDFRGQDEDDPWFDIDGYGPDPSRNRYDAVEFVVKSDIEGQEDLDFIHDYIQRCHDAIMTGDRAQIEELVDLPSLIDMYIIEELSKDCDAGRASFYVCKDRGGKLCFTAPWDFDFGFGNYGPAISSTGLVSSGGSCCIWFETLVRCRWFKKLVLARMEELSPVLEDSLAAITEAEEMLRDDTDRNAEFWNIYGRQYHGYVRSSRESSEENLALIVDWTRERWENLKTAVNRA